VGGYLSTWKEPIVSDETPNPEPEAVVPEVVGEPTVPPISEDMLKQRSQAQFLLGRIVEGLLTQFNAAAVGAALGETLLRLMISIHEALPEGERTDENGQDIFQFSIQEMVSAWETYKAGGLPNELQSQVDEVIQRSQVPVESLTEEQLDEECPGCGRPMREHLGPDEES
jgi:hypothetical protein